MVIVVYRGTETIAEWVETGKCFLETLDGERAEQGPGLRIRSRSVNRREAAPVHPHH